MANFPGIPGYKIISKLNTGGMASVYLGIQEKLNRRVAIKILEPFLLKTKDTALRFEQEAKTAASLSHSNIIQIHDTGKIDDFHYIVMEYLEESLKDKMNLNPKGKMHPEIALDIIDNLMNALDYAHFRGIYHRDIKPENIMFKQDSTPVLVDFGIARVFDSYDELTGTGICMGTADYMSPEQCQFPETVDGRCDIYSLGVVLYEMLTGKKPYKGKSYLSVVLKHIESPVPHLPHKLNRYQPLIYKMMAKDRENRISSGPEFNHLLDRILTNSLGPQPETSDDYTTTETTISIQNIDHPPSPLQTTPEYPDLKKSINKIKSFFKKSLDFIKINFTPDKELKKQETTASTGENQNDAQTVVLKTTESKQQQVQEKLNLAYQYFEKALTILKELENITDPQEVKELGKNINQSLTNIKKQVPPLSSSG
jgi:serine/threonine protein kinase